MRTTLVATVLAALAATGSWGATWRVELDGSGDFTDIQPAVDAAAAGDTILIGPGRFDTFRPCVAPGWTDDTIVWVTKDDLTFIGSGQDVTIIGPPTYSGASGEHPKGFCQFGEFDGSIRNLTIENVENGVYWWHGNLFLEDCNLRALNSSAIGLLIWPAGGMARNCRFEMSSGGRGCVVATAGINFAIEDCQFAGPGYAIAAVGGSQNTNIRRCEIRDPRYGVIIEQGSTASVADCQITDAGEYAILVTTASALTLDRTTVRGAATGISVGGGSSLAGNRVVVENTTREALLFCCNALVTLSTCHILPTTGWAVRCFGSWSNVHTLDLTGNYWGTADAAAIAASIWDGNDETAIQCTMQFVPFADGPVPTESTSWGNLKALLR